VAFRCHPGVKASQGRLPDRQAFVDKAAWKAVVEVGGHGPILRPQYDWQAGAETECCSLSGQFLVGFFNLASRFLYVCGARIVLDSPAESVEA